jgi:hypothetical protein
MAIVEETKARKGTNVFIVDAGKRIFENDSISKSE